MGVRRLGRLIRAVLLVYAATFAVVMLVQGVWPDPQTLPPRSDAIICLGAGMAEETGIRPDAVTRARAQTCAALHAAGAAPLVVFTGAGNDTHSAAEAMAQVAQASGLSADATLIEPAAHSTLQNAGFGLALLPEGPDHLIVVSDAFHLPRAWVIFTALGESVSVYATQGDLVPTWDTRLRWSLREAAAIWFNAARLVAYGAGGMLGIDRDTRIGWFN